MRLQTALADELVPPTEVREDIPPARPTRGIRARRRVLPWVRSTIRVTRDRWRNWSGELESVPGRIYCDDTGGPWKSPRTLADLQAIVRDARSRGATIRAFGSSHSWASLVPNDGGFLVDNRMIGAVDGWYRPFVTPAPADGSRKARATVPPGVLSGEFEEWLWEQGYTLPASAVEDVFSMGGMAATATHGTGLATATISDMISAVTFVDGLGNVQRWSRETSTPDELAAVQCGLGCLGLVFDLTFDVEPRYEVLHESRLVPYARLFADTPAARAALRELHETHDSVEFFWWPLRFSGLPLVSRPEINPEVWVLTTRRSLPRGVPPRGPLRRFIHMQVLDMAAMMSTGPVMTLLQRRKYHAQVMAWITCFTNLWVDARSGAFRMPQYDANHFVNAGGVEFVRAMAAEWSVPFKRHADSEHPEGYERVRQSFAVLHDEIVAAFHRWPLSDDRAVPVTLALEMRTLRASTALMSAGYHPDAASGEVYIAAPELVTGAFHPAWPQFSELANRAMTHQPHIFGPDVRSHLAKFAHACSHPDYPVGGMPAFLRASYRRAGAWQRFQRVRQCVDPDNIFLNPYLREWFLRDD